MRTHSNSMIPAAKLEQLIATHNLKREVVVEVVCTGEIQPVFDVSLQNIATDLPFSIITNRIVTHNSFDSTYFLSIARHVGAVTAADDDQAMQTIFGLKDEKNVWVTQPRVRYYPMSIGEKFFDFIAKLQRVLPDKLYKNGNWWSVYDDSKENRKKLLGTFDEKLLKSSGKLWVPAEDAYPQALVALDSYPAMMPEKQDVDDPAQGLGAQARMFADNLKRIKGKMSSKRITVMGVNQLRQRPMVTYGCYHGSVLVTMADGTRYPIREVVSKQMQGKVVAYNPATNAFEPKSILNWYNNGKASSWLQLDFTGGSILVTPDHLLWSKDLHRLQPAKLFAVGDTLVENGEHPAAATITACTHISDIEVRRNNIVDSNRYEIEVQDLGLFIADGIVGKNSPDYEPCFIGDTPVLLSNGQTLSIADIVEQQLPLRVTSFNPDNNIVQSQEIVDWKANGTRTGTECKTLHFADTSITCTNTHKIWTLDGWREAALLQAGDTVCCISNHALQTTQLTAVTTPTWDRQPVYDLTVDTTHTYAVGNSAHALAVANCGEALKFYCVTASTQLVVLTKDGKVATWSIAQLLETFGETIDYQVQTPSGWETPQHFASFGVQTCIKYRNFIAAEQHRVLAYNDTHVQDWYTLATIAQSFQPWVLHTVDFDGIPNLRTVDASDFSYVGLHPVYDFNFTSGAYVTNELISHNSDTRIKLSSRSVQGGTGQIEEEEGINGGLDTYRYIHLRAQKNKLSIPNLEGWARVWVKDAAGQAHGFDPVFDCFTFMKELGLVTGTKNRLKIGLEKMLNHKPLSWLNFKRLILGDRVMIREVCAAHGIEKPINLRKELFRLFEQGKAMELYFQKKKQEADGAVKTPE